MISECEDVATMNLSDSLVISSPQLQISTMLKVVVLCIVLAAFMDGIGARGILSQIRGEIICFSLK